MTSYHSWIMIPTLETKGGKGLESGFLLNSVFTDYEVLSRPRFVLNLGIYNCSYPTQPHDMKRCFRIYSISIARMSAIFCPSLWDTTVSVGESDVIRLPRTWIICVGQIVVLLRSFFETWYVLKFRLVFLRTWRTMSWNKLQRSGADQESP